MELTVEEKKVLIQVARRSIETRFSGEKIHDIEITAVVDKYPKMEVNAGAFVTLWEEGGLRGCVGYIISDDNLVRTVIKAARQAAFSDSRFRPLKEIELGYVTLEISVLSPPFKMNSYDEIILGRHGLILEDMGRRALLLPQVPIEHKMDRDEFLTALCEKAGLYGNMWQERLLNIEMFTAEVFDERELNDTNADNDQPGNDAV